MYFILFTNHIFMYNICIIQRTQTYPPRNIIDEFSLKSKNILSSKTKDKKRPLRISQFSRERKGTFLWEEGGNGKFFEIQRRSLRDLVAIGNTRSEGIVSIYMRKKNGKTTFRFNNSTLRILLISFELGSAFVICFALCPCDLKPYFFYLKFHSIVIVCIIPF